MQKTQRKRSIAVKLLTESASGKVLGREVNGLQNRKYFRVSQESEVVSWTNHVPVIFRLLRNVFTKACTHTILNVNLIATVI